MVPYLPGSQYYWSARDLKGRTGGLFFQCYVQPCFRYPCQCDPSQADYVTGLLVVNNTAGFLLQVSIAWARPARSVGLVVYRGGSPYVRYPGTFAIAASGYLPYQGYVEKFYVRAPFSYYDEVTIDPSELQYTFAFEVCPFFGDEGGAPVCVTFPVLGSVLYKDVTGTP